MAFFSSFILKHDLLIIHFLSSWEHSHAVENTLYHGSTGLFSSDLASYFACGHAHNGVTNLIQLDQEYVKGPETLNQTSDNSGTRAISQ